jgi:hypothetical protein
MDIFPTAAEVSVPNYGRQERIPHVETDEKKVKQIYHRNRPLSNVLDPTLSR